MKKKIIVILITFIGFFSSCEYKWIETEEISLPEGPVSFSEQIVPVFQSKCVECHSSKNPVLTEDKAYNSLMQDDYINTQEPKNSLLYQKVNGGHPGGSSALSQTEIALILRWIEQGAENN